MSPEIVVIILVRPLLWKDWGSSAPCSAPSYSVEQG